MAKKWKVILPVSGDDMKFRSQTKAYDYVRKVLDRVEQGGTNDRYVYNGMTVYVDEGNGWAKYESFDFSASS